MGRGQFITEPNLLIGVELHEALKPRSAQHLRAVRGRLQSMREFDEAAPKPVVELKDCLFEELSEQDAHLWAQRFLDATPVDADYRGLVDRLSVRRLKEECIPLEDVWPDCVRGQAVATIETAIAALEGQEDREEALTDITLRVKAVASAIAARQISPHELAWSAESAAESAQAAVQSVWPDEQAGFDEQMPWPDEAAEGLAEQMAAESAEYAIRAAEYASWSTAAPERASAINREAARLLAELKRLTVI